MSARGTGGGALVAVERMTNEAGNAVRLQVERRVAQGELELESVTIVGVGPDSRVEHTWTLEEARVLHRLLAVVLQAPGSGV